MMRISTIQEAIVEFILSDQLTPQGVVERTAQQYTSDSADLILVALVSTAYELQHLYSARDPSTTQFGFELYKCAALFACDVAAARANGTDTPTGADVVQYWETVSGGVFLEEDAGAS